MFGCLSRSFLEGILYYTAIQKTLNMEPFILQDSKLMFLYQFEISSTSSCVAFFKTFLVGSGSINYWWFRNPANHLGCIKNLVNNGINYQDQLVIYRDFWTINSITFNKKRQTFLSSKVHGRFLTSFGCAQLWSSVVSTLVKLWRWWMRAV